MKNSSLINILLMAGTLGCSSPTRIEVAPSPLVLEGKGTEGRLIARIFDENGKELTDDHKVVWMCLDEKTIKIRQDGTVVALSSGKALVDVEIVGSETPGLPGTGIHGTGTVIVRIPGWIEMSNEELLLESGAPPTAVWAEVRNDQNHTVQGYLPTWTVDNPSIVSIAPWQNASKTRVFLMLTPLAQGETYISAVYQDLAADIHIVVSPAGSVDTNGDPQADSGSVR